jgi:hypothetical protein
VGGAGAPLRELVDGASIAREILERQAGWRTPRRPDRAPA